MECESLGEMLLFTTIRLKGSITNGTSIGTGFLFEYMNRVFIVTNKHVVKDVIKGQYCMMKADTSSKQWRPIVGNGILFDFEATDFIGHPNTDIDVAVADISLKIIKAREYGNAVYCVRVGTQNIPSKRDINEFISPLEDIVFIGYPNGLWDSKNLLPIIRKGITATPYYYDFMGEKKFLVDASVFPGSSGSPVFIYYSGGYPDKEGNFHAGNRIFFIGIISKTYEKVEEGEIKIKDIPTLEVPYSVNKQMIDLGIVYKASTIIETMNFYLKQA